MTVKKMPEIKRRMYMEAKYMAILIREVLRKI